MNWTSELETRDFWTLTIDQKLTVWATRLARWQAFADNDAANCNRAGYLHAMLAADNCLGAIKDLTERLNK